MQAAVAKLGQSQAMGVQVGADKKAADEASSLREYFDLVRLCVLCWLAESRLLVIITATSLQHWMMHG